MGLAASATLEWVGCFHQRRLPGPIGSIPPAEKEQGCARQPEGSAMAA